jgi:uncharacterized protein
MNGISKGGLGGAAGSVSTPLMALAIPPAQAAAILLPILCVMDLAGIRAYLGKWDRRLVTRVMLPAGLLGCVIGTFTFRAMKDDWIRVLLGVIALGFLAWSLVPKRAAARIPTHAEGWLWCALSGFTSFVASVGSPPLLVWILPQKLEKVAFVATLLVFFAVLNWFKVPAYGWLGLLDTRNLLTSLLLVPVGVAGTYVGVWMQTRIDVRVFYRIVYALLFATGAKLLYDGVTGLAA